MALTESGRSSDNVVRDANLSAVKAYRKRLEILGRACRTFSAFLNHVASISCSSLIYDLVVAVAVVVDGKVLI